MKEYLDKMTELALEYDIIIAQPLQAAEVDYDPQYGSKLFWDVENNKYVAKMPDGTIT